MVDAVIFDLDGVLIDSESVWDAARRAIVADNGGTWTETATRAMQGMRSPEWSRYLRDELGVSRDPGEISRQVVERMLASYEREVPLLPGAVQAVRRLAGRWPLGLASSSNRPVIDAVLETAGLAKDRWSTSTARTPGFDRGHRVRPRRGADRLRASLGRRARATGA